MEPHWIYYWRVTRANGTKYTTRHRATEETIRAQTPEAIGFERIEGGQIFINGVELSPHKTYGGPSELPPDPAAPRFDPGSGWYRHGNLSPGTPAEVQARRTAALRCVVYPMRIKGAKRVIAELVDLQPYDGSLILSDDFTRPNWTAMLHDHPSMAMTIMAMHEATVVRARGGFRQIRGIEWGEKAMARWPQAWFCAPNVEAARAVLSKMV